MKCIRVKRIEVTAAIARSSRRSLDVNGLFSLHRFDTSSSHRSSLVSLLFSPTRSRGTRQAGYTIINYFCHLQSVVSVGLSLSYTLLSSKTGARIAAVHNSLCLHIQHEHPRITLQFAEHVPLLPILDRVEHFTATVACEPCLCLGFITERCRAQGATLRIGDPVPSLMQR